MPKTSFLQKILLLFLSFIIVLVILEVGLRIGGYVVWKRQEWANQKKLQEKNAIKIMCVGESTTAFGGPSSYPSQMEEILNKQLPGHRISVLNQGAIGVTTDYIRDDIGTWLEKFQPDVVVLMMGINDCNSVIPVDRRAAQTFPFLKSLRVYKLYRWFKKNWIYRNASKKNLEPKRPYVTLAREPLMYLGLWRAFARDRKMSAWGADNKEFYINYTRLLLENHRYANLSEVMDFLLGRKLPYYWMTTARLNCSSPVFKRIFMNFFNKIHQGMSWNSRYLSAQARCYEEAGEMDQAEKKFKEAKRVEHHFIDPEMRKNYLEILGKISKRHIPFILVQYPMRDVRALKRMVARKLDIQHQIFVDNEEIFKKAVAKEGYKALFIDRFAGDFGHCTPLGNHLLAENVAKAVMQLLGREKAGEKDQQSQTEDE